MAIDNTIKVTFDPKSQRLLFQGGFHFLDLFRSFPSRRFDPKSKAWKMPLVKANYTYFAQLIESRQYQLDLSPETIQALLDFEKLSAPPAHVEIPREFFTEIAHPPLSHQWDMMDKGWNLRGYALFAAMGTGKTYVTVNMARVRFKTKKIRRVVVICPQTLRRTWRREFEKWAPGMAECFNLGDSGYEAWCNEPTNKLKVLCVSVEGLGISTRLYDLVYKFLEGGGVMAVCDESSRIKNPEAKRTQRAIALASLCDYRMILNGTPIAKGIQDLWSQYEFIDPNIIGTGDYWAFKTRYVVMGGYENKQIIGYSNVEELMKMIQPHTLEVDKKVLNLPPKIYKTRTIEPTPEQNRLFEKILTGIGDGPLIQVQNVLERMLRLQQVIGGFEPRTDPETMITTTVPLAKNPKMDDLMEFINDNYHGTKFIIWARYIPEIELIRESLRKKYGDMAVLDYYGATSAEDRATAEDRYCGDPTARFLVGNPSAAGLGLTLISGENDVMYYYSGTFAYIDRTQSEDRNHRIGQSNTVVVMDAVMEGSLDEAIQGAIREKKDMDQYVKDWIAAGKSVRDLVRGI